MLAMKISSDLGGVVDLATTEHKINNAIAQALLRNLRGWNPRRLAETEIIDSSNGVGKYPEIGFYE